MLANLDEKAKLKQKVKFEISNLKGGYPKYFEYKQVRRNGDFKYAKILRG